MCMDLNNVLLLLLIKKLKTNGDIKSKSLNKSEKRMTKEEEC